MKPLFSSHISVHLLVAVQILPYLTYTDISKVSPIWKLLKVKFKGIESTTYRR